MAIQKLNIGEFLSLASQNPVLDVRSPGEYLHAHFPGAYSLPLFTDEERKVVGTTYKQQSREAAIKIGLDFFGPKMKRMIEEVEQLLVFPQDPARSFKLGSLNPKPKTPVRTGHPGGQNPETVLVYCWRGGMRSTGVAWLLDLYGFNVYTLTGGYKSFRKWVLNSWQYPWSFKILGGYTGSGKTKVLKELEEKGEPVIDLEAVASHKGSAFGALGLPPQPSQEMFENLLAVKLFEVGTRKSEVRKPDDFRESFALPTSDCRLPTADFRLQTPAIWIEDESQRIGTLNIPQQLWKRMRLQPVFFLDVPIKERLSYLVNEYGRQNKGDLAAAITRIQKKLGGLETKTALNCLVENDVSGCFRILLKYYDKLYSRGLQNRSDLQALLTKIECSKVDEKLNAQKLVNCKQVA